MNNVTKLPIGYDGYIRAIEREMKEVDDMTAIFQEGYDTGYSEGRKDSFVITVVAVAVCVMSIATGIVL